MTVDEAKTKLAEIAAAMRDQFPKNTGRLEQFEHHITTAVMAVEHLFDEQARADHARAERIRQAENAE